MTVGGDVFLEDLGPFVDQCQQAALNNFLIAEGAPLIAQAFSDLHDEPIDVWVMHGFAAALGILVIATPGLLAKTAQFAQGVVDLHQRAVHTLPG
ncbi:hypothetical protein D3C72_2083130 [compost metagenome]